MKMHPFGNQECLSCSDENAHWISEEFDLLVALDKKSGSQASGKERRVLSGILERAICIKCHGNSADFTQTCQPHVGLGITKICRIKHLRNRNVYK